jgi:hypothetical protein
MEFSLVFSFITNFWRPGGKKLQNFKSLKAARELCVSVSSHQRCWFKILLAFLATSISSETSLSQFAFMGQQRKKYNWALCLCTYRYCRKPGSAERNFYPRCVPKNGGSIWLWDPHATQTHKVIPPSYEDPNQRLIPVASLSLRYAPQKQPQRARTRGIRRLLSGMWGPSKNRRVILKQCQRNNMPRQRLNIIISEMDKLIYYFE